MTGLVPDPPSMETVGWQIRVDLGSEIRVAKISEGRKDSELYAMRQSSEVVITDQPTEPISLVCNVHEGI